MSILGVGSTPEVAARAPCADVINEVAGAAAGAGEPEPSERRCDGVMPLPVLPTRGGSPCCLSCEIPDGNDSKVVADEGSLAVLLRFRAELRGTTKDEKDVFGCRCNPRSLRSAVPSSSSSSSSCSPSLSFSSSSSTRSLSASAAVGSWPSKEVCRRRECAMPDDIDVSCVVKGVAAAAPLALGNEITRGRLLAGLRLRSSLVELDDDETPLSRLISSSTCCCCSPSLSLSLLFSLLLFPSEAIAPYGAVAPTPAACRTGMMVGLGADDNCAAAAARGKVGLCASSSGTARHQRGSSAVS